MFDAVTKFLRDLAAPDAEAPATTEDDIRLAAAALMFHVVAIDGVITDEERHTLREQLQARFAIDDRAARRLVDDAGAADAEAVDLYGFTSVLKQNLEVAERERIVEMMWRLVFADGDMHEFEDNLVWRVAELLGVSSQARIRLKQSVRDGAG